MTDRPGAKDAPRQDLFGLGERDRQAVLAWVGEHLTQVRRSVYEQRLLHWSLGIAFVVGLAAQIGGYLLRSSVTSEPLLLVADLLSMRWGGHCGPGSWWCCSCRSFRRSNGGSSSKCWMPTTQRSAMRPEPEASSPRGTTERRRQANCGHNGR